MGKRIAGFLLWCGVVLAVFAHPLTGVIRESLLDGYTSHASLIPIISIYLILSKRSKISCLARYDWWRAAQIAACGVVPLAIALELKGSSQLSFAPCLTVLSAIFFLVAGFIAFFGRASVAQAIFPICLLAFMLPIPSSFLDKIIYFLQGGSAKLSAWMFSALGVPVLRDGFLLTVPGVTIEVATECSGINSSIALLIIMLLLAREVLRTTWRRVLVVLLVVPLSLVKNAIRIVTLTMLATRVDPGFLTGRLHHEGGFVFFLIALALLYPVLMLLKRTEGPVRGPEATRASEIAALS